MGFEPTMSSLSVSRAWVMAMNLTPWLSSSRRLARQSSRDRPNLSSFQQRTISSFRDLGIFHEPIQAWC
jgi:hypothetical protein